MDVNKKVAALPDGICYVLFDVIIASATVTYVTLQ
jgi:hypothetical protein